MTRTKFLKGECQHCGGYLEFPAEIAGLQAPCPHCGQQTEMLLAAPPEEPTVPRRTIVWTLIGVTILCLGLVGALAALRRAERWAARQKQQAATSTTAQSNLNSVVEPSVVPPGSSEQNGFIVSPVTLETTEGTSRVYVTGTLRNQSDRKRFGIKVELDLFNAAEEKVGTATDYKPVMEPGTEWRFKALVLDAKTTSAKLASIKEDQ